MILNLLELNFKNSGLRYPIVRKGIWMLEWSIRMQKKTFGYTGSKIWATKAEGIRMHRRGIQMLENEVGCPRRYSYTLGKLLHGGYPNA